jgi:hypothetical protein
MMYLLTMGMNQTGEIRHHATSAGRTDIGALQRSEQDFKWDIRYVYLL